jgi:Tol biopolymer transport system component
MTPERRKWIEELYQAARKGPEIERRALLDRADPDLRAEVESLLMQDSHAGPIDGPVGSVAKTMDDTVTQLAPSAHVGPYRIESRLGAGGMGEVFRARDTKLDREVAIKTLPPEFARDSDRLARFRREARTLASLNHPNIAAIYGLEQFADSDCLVLELVEGENLKGPLPIERALDYAGQVADALEAAHEKGIVHRDLKPGNVKVTPQGRVKVLDFGLAKAVWDPRQDFSAAPTMTASQTMAGHIVGTPGYMSPEQARGQPVDKRADIWAFGCLLYELLTGKRVFEGASGSDRVAAVLEREPDWSVLPARTPAKIRNLLRDCLQKQANRRLANISDARRIIGEAQRRPKRWYIAAAVVALAGLAGGSVLWLRAPARVVDRSEWLQLTKFPDSVAQPALSPDGRMLAFLRTDSNFFDVGQVYVKFLPDGDPVQLTHDAFLKMSPVFSPDGTRIAYTAVDPEFHWDTWMVPVLGGEPQLLLRNASGLTWTGPRQILFSEIKTGDHMGIETSDESRAGQRPIYLPASEFGMAHRSYLSPNGKWVLLVEMDIDHLWESCRVVPADGSSPGRRVGPPGGGCVFGAWSPESKWIYLNSNAGGASHIWRQRFPGGEPELITPGPTEEEGIAMAADGKSFVTAMVVQNTSLWVHDSRGERQISLEGNAAEPRFTPDGERLLCRIVKQVPSESGFYRDYGEVKVVDLKSGRAEPLVRGFEALDYDISHDGRVVVMETADKETKSRLWVAMLDRSAPPRQIPNVEGGSPRFLPGGDIIFRGPPDGGFKYLYRAHLDGTGIRKVLDLPIAIMGQVSRDGKWFAAFVRTPGTNRPPTNQAVELDTGRLMNLGLSDFGWLENAVWFGGSDGRTTYIIPLKRGQSLPPVPSRGFLTDEEIARLPGARKVDAQPLSPGPSPDVYAFYRGAAQRNLYRIPIR